MFESIKRMIDKFFTGLLLWGYGWERREHRRSDECHLQWRDPLTGLWYRQNTAMRLLKIQVLDEYKRR